MALKLSRFIKLFLRKKHPCPGGQVGQSLFEIIIAVALVGLILGLGTALITAALQAAERARVQATASRLAQELMESVSAIAGSSWHKIYCPPAGEGSGNCSTPKGTPTPNKFYATSTLMAYWPMDEISGDAVADTSGFGNTGTANGTTIVDGYANKARQFNGTSDYVSVTSAPGLKLGTQQTVEIWVKVNNDASDWVRLVGKGDSTYRNYGLWLATDGTILYQLYSSGGSCSAQTTAVVNDSNWHHAAGTYNGGDLRVYIDGIEKGSTPCTQTPYTSDDPTTIGYAGFHTYFNGIIDEVRIYNRALPQYEIQQHYLKAKDVLSKTPASGTESLVFGNNTYTRWFTVKNVSRDSSGNIMLSSEYDPDFDDPSTQKITVSVTAQRLLATTSIVQFITRSQNEVYRQTEWICGVIPTDTPSPVNPCGYLSASSTILNRGQYLELDTD